METDVRLEDIEEGEKDVGGNKPHKGKTRLKYGENIRLKQNAKKVKNTSMVYTNLINTDFLTLQN